MISLRVWGSAWNCPSIDINSLYLMTYSRFSNKDIDFNSKNLSIISLIYSIPYLKYGQKFLFNILDIIELLRKENCDIDAELPEDIKADVFAYSSYLQKNLYPGIIFTFWLDDENCKECTRPAYAGFLKFPFGIFTLSQLYWHYYNILNGLHLSDKSLQDSSSKSIIYATTKNCLNSISNLLNANQYLFGTKKPSSADALMYAYLAPLYYAPLKNTELQAHLKACPNLISFIENITKSYFDINYAKGDQEKKKSTFSPDDWPGKRRNKILWAILSLTAMTSYALYSGIVKVRIIDEY